MSYLLSLMVGATTQFQLEDGTHVKVEISQIISNQQAERIRITFEEWVTKGEITLHHQHRQEMYIPANSPYWWLLSSEEGVELGEPAKIIISPKKEL